MKKQISAHLCTIVIFLFHTTHCVHEPLSKPLQPFVKATSKLFELILSGYTKMDSFYDTRQVVSRSEGGAASFPREKIPDICNRDINANGEFNMLVFETRLRLDIKGPKILKSDAKAVIEGEFFGSGNGFNLYNLRHSFVQLDWKPFSILLGQYYHPMYVEDCAPDPMPADGGAPMAVGLKEPQCRFTYHLKHLDLIAAALSQLNNVSPGPDGFKSKYARNSLMPNFHFQARANVGKHFFGAGIDLKRLVPRLVTNENIRASESIFSVAGTAYFASNWPKIATRFKINVGQNVANFDMIGGYAVQCVNEETDHREYVNLRTLSFWTEFIYLAIKRFEPAIFIGYTKNFGADKTIVKNIPIPNAHVEPTIYVLGREIDNVFRVSPRLRWIIGPVTLGLETEYTRAAYGEITDTGSVTVTNPVANVRFLFSAYYFF